MEGAAGAYGPGGEGVGGVEVHIAGGTPAVVASGSNRGGGASSLSAVDDVAQCAWAGQVGGLTCGAPGCRQLPAVEVPLAGAPP